MAVTLHVCPGDRGTVVCASGDVDTNAAEPFQDTMLGVMRRYSPWLLLDLSGVSFMDCAGLRALLLTRRRAELRGGSVCLIAESPAVRRIIDILGVRDALPVRDWARGIPPGYRPGSADNGHGQAAEPVRAEVNRAACTDYRRSNLP
jgi:anti-anti-sigma factor